MKIIKKLGELKGKSGKVFIDLLDEINEELVSELGNAELDGFVVSYRHFNPDNSDKELHPSYPDFAYGWGIHCSKLWIVSIDGISNNFEHVRFLDEVSTDDLMFFFEKLPDFIEELIKHVENEVERYEKLLEKLERFRIE